MAAFSFGFGDGSTPNFDPNFGGDVTDNINAAVRTGLQAFNTYEQSQLLAKQIDRGQTPSIVGVPGAPSGALAAALPNALGGIGSSSLGTLLVFGVVVLIVVMLFRR
jgi:hypothetical protein